MILGLHTALNVSNYQRSLEFYRDILGMKVIRELNITDDRIARLTGVPKARCLIAHLEAGKSMLELFQYYEPIGKNFAIKMKQFDQGLIHIGIEVDNFRQVVENLKKINVEFLGEKVEFRPEVWVMYFKGPDGEVCELRQQQ